MPDEGIPAGNDSLVVLNSSLTPDVTVLRKTPGKSGKLLAQWALLAGHSLTKPRNLRRPGSEIVRFLTPILVR
ncbi:hypothetical protein BJA01nite_43640 [Bradyrhizobium japonicum]|nr:hypothetical protein BJ6T_28880 [Bradyrhizobium japonicum USDA 6]GEC46722.1 hypothetical protein BJA01nite_43640 [Bradyrhizobium japonicum]